MFFSADNRYVHLVASQGFLTSIELEPTHHRQSQIEDEVALSSGAEFDGAGGLRILEPSELAALAVNSPKVDGQRTGIPNETGADRARNGRPGLFQPQYTLDRGSSIVDRSAPS